MSRSKFLSLFLGISAAFIVALSGSTTLAQTVTWDADGATAGQTDGAGAWLDPSQWWDGANNQTWTSGWDAIFGLGGTGGAVTLASPTTVNSLTFNSFSGTYTLGTAGQTITLNNGITVNSSAGAVTIDSPITLGAGQTWTNNSSNLLTVTGDITNGANLLTISGTGNTVLSGILGSGSGGLTKSGPGTVTLAGANSYTGATTIGQGTLKLGGTGSGANSPLGTTATGTTVSATGAALDVNGFTLTTAEPLTLNGSGLSSTGALTNSGGAATYSGAITLASASSIGSTNGTLTISGVVSGAFGLTFTGSGNTTLSTALNSNVPVVTKLGAGNLTIAVDNSANVAPISINNGTLTLSGAGKLGNTSGSITFTAVNAARTDGNTGSFGAPPAGFNVGSFVLGQAVYALTSSNAYTSGNPVGFASGATTFNSGVMALPGGAIVVDNSGANVNYRFGGSVGTPGRGVALGGASLTLIPSSSGNVSENLSGLVFMQGHSVVTLNADPNFQTNVIAALLNQHGTTAETALIRGSGLGSAAANGVATLTFTAAPTLIGITTTGATATTQGVLPYVIADSTAAGFGNRFATHSGANTKIRQLAAGEMSASSAYTAASNVLLAGTQAAITANTSINSLTIDSGNVTITNPAFLTTVPTLTISSGGLLTNTAASTISGGIVTWTTPLNVFTPGANAGANVLTVSSRMNGNGLIKAGGGTLLLSSVSPAFPSYSQNTFGAYGNHAGSIYINEGTVKLGAHNALGSTGFTSSGQNDGNNVTLNPGGILDLNGKSQFVGGLSSGFSGDNSPTGPTGLTGGTITGSGGNIMVTTGNPGGGPVSYVYAGSVQGSVGFAIEPGGVVRQDLTGPNSSSGPVLINGSPNTQLRDYGTFSATTQLSINSSAGLTIENTTLANINGRLNPLGQLVFNNNGTLIYKGRAQTLSTESAGALIINTGHDTITVTPGGTNVNSADLTFSSIATNGGTVTFSAGGGTMGASGSGNPHININGATVSSLQGAGVMVNNIIPWATVGGANFASYTPYTIVNGLGSGGIVTVSGQINANPTNVNAPTADYTTGSSFTITSDVNINSLRSTGFQSVAFTTGSEVLNLTAGGLFVDGSITNTIGATLDSGRLTAGGGASTGTSNLYLFQTNRGYVINSRIIDNPNGAKVKLVTGSTELALRDANTYTGGTTLNGNTSYLINASSATVIPNATTPSDGLVLNGATLNQQNSVGQIGASNIVTVTGNSTLNLYGNNTLAGLVLNNIGTSAPTINTTPSALQTSQYGVTGFVNSSTDITLTLTGGITTTSNNIASVAIINGRVNLPASPTINVGAATFNGLAINPWSTDLAVKGLTGGGGTITKSGAGNLRMDSATVVTGVIDVTGGGLLVGAGGAGARLADVILEDGTNLNLNGFAGTFGSLATGGTGTGIVTNTGGAATLTVGFANTNTTFAGSFQRRDDSTINLINMTKIGTGTMTLTGNNGVNSTASGNLIINSTAGGGITFKDAGTNNFLQSGIVVNVGGTLTLDDSGANNLSNRLTNGGVTLSGGTFVSTAAAAGSTETTTGALTLSSGESTILLNQGATSNVTTFGTLSQNTGSSATFGGVGIGTATNKVVITSGPGLVNHILPRVAVGADFATYNENGNGVNNTNGIQAIIAGAYTIPTDINTAVSTNNVKIDASVTTRNLSAARNVNSLNIIDNGATIGTNGALLPTVGLTIGSGAVMVNGSGASISTPVLALSAEGIFRVNSGASLTVNSRITGSSGLTKTGAGSMTLANLQEYTGTTTVNQGTLILAGGKNTLAVGLPGATGQSVPSFINLSVNGGTLDLNGNSQAVGSISSSNPLSGGGGTITNNSATAATLTTFAQGATFGGQLSGNLSVIFNGSNNTGFNTVSQTLTNQQSYSGATILRDGKLVLQDKGALYSGVGDLSNASVQLNYATLLFDNTNLNPSAAPPTRIPSAVPFTLNAGNILVGPGASVDNSTSLGTVNINSSINTIAQGTAAPATTTATAFANGQGATTTLTINNLTHSSANGGTVSLLAYSNQYGGYPNSLAMRMFVTNVDGNAVTAGALLPAWVGVGNGTANTTYFTDFATLSSTGYGIVSYGDTSLGGVGYGASLGTGNVASVAGATLGAGTTLVKALKNTGTITVGALNTLNVEGASSGGLVSAGIIGGTYGASANDGKLTAGGSTSTGTVDLYAYNTATLNSVITDNPAGAKVRLIIANGNNATLIAGNNTHSGGTIIMDGREGQFGATLGGTGTVIPNGGLTLYSDLNGNSRGITTTAVGQIATGNDVNLIGATVFLTMAAGTTNTLSSINFENTGNGNGGNTNPFVNAATNLILTKTTGNGALTSINNNYNSIPNITGTLLTLPDGATITTSGDAPTSLIIGTTTMTTSATTTPLHKAGAGSLIITGQNSFANGFNLDAGSLIFSASSVGGGTGGTPPTTSQIGTGGLTLADGTAIMGSSAVSIGNLVSVASNATFTFGTLDATNARANANNNLTLTNTVTLGTGAQGINVNGLLMTGTISGKLTGGGTGFTKSGPGTLVLSNAANDFTGSISISGGTLQQNTSGAVPSGRVMNISGGAAFNMNAISQSVDSLNGAGSVINPGAAAVLTISGSTNGSFSGVIASTTTANLSVVKGGSNTQTLSGVQAYGGATTINLGKLTIASTGAINSTSGVSIGAGEFNYNSSTAMSQPVSFSGTGGTLSGTGAITPTVTVTAGNTISPGNSVGTLSFGTDLILAGTTNMEITGNAAANTYDKIILSGGALTYGGTLTVTVLNTNPTTSGAYTLFSGFGSQSGLFSTVNLPTIAGFQWHDFDPGPGVNYVDYANGRITLDSTAAPNDSVLSAATGSVSLGRIMLNGGVTQNVAISRASGSSTTGFSASATGNATVTGAGAPGSIPPNGSIAVGVTNATGIQSGTVDVTNSGDDNGGGGPSSAGAGQGNAQSAISISVTGTVLANRTFQSIGNLSNTGPFHIGQAYSGNATLTTLAGTAGDDDHATRVTVGGGSSGGANNLSIASTATIFNSASQAEVRPVTGTFTTSGIVTGSITLQTAAAGTETATGTTPQNVAVNFSINVTNGFAGWVSDTSGNWSNNAKWFDTQTINAAPGLFAGFDNVDTATFDGTGVSSPSLTQTVTLNGVNPSVKSVTFSNFGGNDVAFTIAPAASETLTLKSNSGNATITANSPAAQTITAPITISSSTDITNAGGGNLALSGAITSAGGGNTVTLTRTGAGTLTTGSISNSGTLAVVSGSAVTTGNISSSAGATTVGDDGSLTIGTTGVASRIVQNSLTINGTAGTPNALVTIAAGPASPVGGPSNTRNNNQTSRLSSLSIASAGTTTYPTASPDTVYYGTLDLTNNSLFIPYGNNVGDDVAAYNAIEDMVRSGFNGGDWMGKGITSSIAATVDPLLYGVNVYDNAIAGLADYTSLGTNTIVAKFGYNGDTNGDGAITADDYTVVDLALASSPLFYMSLMNGDTNHDGQVTADDYTYIDINILNDVANPGLNGGANAVPLPEPSSFVLGLLGLIGLLFARRRVTRKTAV